MTKPARERIVLPPIELGVRISHGSNLVYVSLPPPYNGPTPRALLAKDRTVSSAIAALEKQRRAVVDEGRRVTETARRERAAIDRNAADAAARIQKINETRVERFERVETRRKAIAEKLRALLDKHEATLTLEGAVLRANAYHDFAEDELERRLDEMEASGKMDPTVVIDVSVARTIVDDLFARFPAASTNVAARFARARIYYIIDKRAGGLLMLQLARDSPPAREQREQREPKVTESAYHAAAHALWGEPDLAAREGALEAFRWLADNAATHEMRSIARYRVGELHVRAKQWPEGIAEMCKVVDDPKADSGAATDALHHLAQPLLRGGLAPLRAACSARQCPCKDEVLADVAAQLRRAEDDPQLRDVASLGSEHFPQSPHAATWRCDLAQIEERETLTRKPASGCESGLPTRGEGSDADHATADIVGSKALQYCVSRGVEEQRTRVPGRLTVEVAIDARGVAEKVTITEATTDRETSDCIATWFERHRWIDLGGMIVVAPLTFDH